MSRRSTLATALAVAAVGALPAAALAQAPVAPAPTPLAPGVIAPGVSIAEVPVGGLSQADATQAVIDQHVLPRRVAVPITFRGRNLKPVDPVKVGYVPKVDYAVQVALLYGRTKALPAEGVTVPLKEKINRKRLIATLRQRAAANDVTARDASVRVSGTTPVATKARIGTVVDVPKAAEAVERAILVRDVSKVALASKRVVPSVTSAGPIVIVDRGNFRLTWWRAGKKITFPIAVGSYDHPTPTGNFSVIQKQKNPTWFPPDSPWAAGLGPIPPGVSNPLGTRWIGTSAPAIGMHGTPSSGSIGSRASHGCIRMYIHDAERLYDLVDIGTPVYIR